LEPWDLDEAFFDLWDDPRLCRHLHLPLQSGSAATLRRMARKVTPQGFAALVEAARQRIPDVAITTDVIVGFPGETGAEFDETRAFVEQMDFAGAHIFTYSARPGTAAASMPAQVHNYTRKQRGQVLRQITDRSAAEYQARFVGQELEVLWENAENDGGNWALSGLTDNYLRVEASASQPVWNQITPTKLVETGEHGLRGELLELPDSLVIE
jgi:threonylcarbamoyladenosine tRNA methylthiotransferase MtaB